jgi:hypothetical protein
MKMKRTWSWILVTCAVVGIGYAIPIAVWNARPDSLDGFYGQDTPCGCGHSIFWQIEDGSVFSTCPGHKRRDLVYTLLPTNGYWAAVHHEQSNVWFEVRRQRGDVEFTRVREGFPRSAIVYARVKNPWRLWLPRILPE